MRAQTFTVTNCAFCLPALKRKAMNGTAGYVCVVFVSRVKKKSFLFNENQSSFTVLSCAANLAFHFSFNHSY